MSNRRMAAVAALSAAILLLLGGAAHAVDEEGCLFCHGLAIRSAGSGDGGRDLRVWEPAGGEHDALFCSDCHADARRAPHAAAPGPAQCIEECHGQTAEARESHRRASFGGLSESHRGAASPDAPCRLCHRAVDSPGNTGAILARCAACHPKERESEVRGVHARLAGRGGYGLCASCHAAHPAGAGDGKARCGGPGCHKTVTTGMTRLAGHRGAVPGGAASEGAVVIGLGVLGWIAGRRLSPPGPKGGDGG
ncbi:MAG: hypothetical protein ACM3NF_06325 [Gemmatimonadota bacterium]